jgi:hypothetical protein
MRLGFGGHIELKAPPDKASTSAVSAAETAKGN